MKALGHTPQQAGAVYMLMVPPGVAATVVGTVVGSFVWKPLLSIATQGSVSAVSPWLDIFVLVRLPMLVALASARQPREASRPPGH
jgi:hypothetical protein